MAHEGAMRWLRTNIESNFWDQTKDLLDKIDYERREEMVIINEQMGLSTRKAFLKHLSYHGVVRVPPECPECHYETEGVRYIDPKNWIYAKVFRSAWPRARASREQNDHTVGDLVEALLGWHFTLTMVHKRRIEPIAEDFVKMLEKACLTCWALHEYFEA